jgi:hypothetical protein
VIRFVNVVNFFLDNGYLLCDAFYAPES